MADRHPLVETRERMGKLSQDAFGALLGVDGMTVYRWESGVSLPRRKFWPKLEELTGKPIAEVIAATKPVREVAQ